LRTYFQYIPGYNCSGLDSPAPRIGSEAPRRQQTETAEAFSWLNDKIGDMKITKADNNIFQFPPVSNAVKESAVNHHKIYSSQVRTDSYAPVVPHNNFSDDQLRPYHNQLTPAAAFMMSQPDIRFQSQQQHVLREKELERKNLEKIKQHKLEREQQWRQQEDMKRQQEELRRQQEELRRQQQEMEIRRRREAEQQLREDEALAGARKKLASGLAGQSDVFHFQQISTLSTAGQSQQTYAVDRNFIRELEKNLGDNESKAFSL
jgi:hypothetical protein